MSMQELKSLGGVLYSVQSTLPEAGGLVGAVPVAVFWVWQMRYDRLGLARRCDAMPTASARLTMRCDAMLREQHDHAIRCDEFCGDAEAMWRCLQMTRSY